MRSDNKFYSILRPVYTMSQKIALCFLLTISVSSCKKFVDIPPPQNQLVGNVVFTNEATAVATITGIYSQMMGNPNLFSSGLTTFYCGMSADELYYYTPGYRDEFVKNEITLLNHGNLASYFWNPCYYYIYTANACIEGLNASTALTPALKSRLLGEAKFIRSFCYFYLINLFGDTPLITATDYTVNSGLPRLPKATIYAYLINDLKDAQNLLPVNYPTAERVRPNKWAAAALLARIYLYTQDWANAEAQATGVIDAGLYSLVTNPNNVFLRGSAEAIWQLQPSSPVFNTWEGFSVLSASATASPQYLLTPSLMASFDTGDLRKTAWVASRVVAGKTLYYPTKYKVRGGSSTVPLTEFYMVLRLAEQYLIRAEARAAQNKITEAVADINAIRKRAGLPNLAVTTPASLSDAIEHERRIELFAEWGHRWLDLKRTDRADAVLKVLKPTTWQPRDTLWPIPISQLNANPSLTQNPGY